MSTSRSLAEAAHGLGQEVDTLTFGAPVAVVYNPLVYARKAHTQYLDRYANGARRVVFLGMNPGPWGMTQTGVPFGDVETVRGWLGIDAEVKPPARVHPARPVLGLRTRRVEVSGKRLWGLMKDRWGTPERFFRDHFVANYCPLMFVDSGGRNLTPDRLSAGERAALTAMCDRHLARLIGILEARWIVGVGGFAAKAAERVVKSHMLTDVSVGRIPHPSPASPAANKGWARQAEAALVELGLWSPRRRA